MKRGLKLTIKEDACEEAKKLFGKDPYIGEILTKQRDIYCAMDVQAPESIASLCVDAGM